MNDPDGLTVAERLRQRQRQEQREQVQRERARGGWARAIILLSR